MIITGIQLPYGTGDVKDLKGTKNQEDFLAVLTKAIKTEIEGAEKIDLEGLESEDTNSVDEGESVVDIVSKLGVFLNMPLCENETTPDIQQIENPVSNNIGVLQAAEIPSNTQIGLTLEGAEVNETIIPGIQEMPFNDIQSMVSEIVSEHVSIPDALNARQLGDDVSFDNNIDLDSEMEPKKNECVSNSGRESREIIKKSEDEEVKFKEHESDGTNQPGRLKDTIFNTYVHEDRVITNETDNSFENQVMHKENVQNIGETIIQLMETTTEGQTSVMKVQLYPEELGTVNVMLKMDKGKISTKILVDNDQIKQLFAAKVGEISENLFKQNINMDRVEVELNLSAMENENSYFDSNGSSNRNNHEQFKQNHFMKFDFEKEFNLEDLTDRYSNLSSISILA